ncbi:MAG: hypothetical protein HQ558_05550 [Candidatus Omnitrophica bacterium]|nr:hypothetical protein [Candidatus Omnitrophota bacterium]
MYKKIMAIFLVAVFMLGCCGCSGSWRRKFVRKKDAEEKEGPILQPIDYEKEFTNRQLYANHFAFWKSAESELIYSLDTQKSRKRIEMYSSYAFVEIKKLHELLMEQQQQEIRPLLEELKDMAARIKDREYISSNRNFMVRRLKKHYRMVNRKFSYLSMKKYIRKSEGLRTVAEISDETDTVPAKDAILKETPKEADEASQ